jgi:hypothetical protein
MRDIESKIGIYLKKLLRFLRLAQKPTRHDVILSIAVANEISCRVSSVSDQFHRRGFHPTGLFAPHCPDDRRPQV